jgi:hypothetical protein
MLYDNSTNLYVDQVTVTDGLPTFSQIVAECAQQTDDDMQIASYVCRRLQLTQYQVAILWPVVLDRCRTIGRNNVRRVEQAAKPNKPGRKVDPTADRVLRMTTTFTPGDGRRVTWGEATIADHEMRIDFLGRKRSGLDATMKRHRQAIDDIRRAGVNCLNEITEVAK